jgi:hypothetical protein
MTGMVPATPTTAGASDFDSNTVHELIRHLNCVTSTPGAYRAPQTEESILQIKLSLMETIWLEEWGSFAEFWNWAAKISLDDPNPFAKAIFDEVHSLCSPGSPIP